MVHIFQIGHCMGTILRDPLSYVTFSFRSLEVLLMTVSTVQRNLEDVSKIQRFCLRHSDDEMLGNGGGAK